MYLNAQVYTGTAKNTEAITYAKKVIAGGYTLSPIYRTLLWQIMTSRKTNLCLLLLAMV
jgi:hypothetical protein